MPALLPSPASLAQESQRRCPQQPLPRRKQLFFTCTLPRSRLSLGRGPLARAQSGGEGISRREGAGEEGPWKALRQGALSMLLSAAVATAGPVLAADTVKVGTCLLANCRGALARCAGDVECVESIACLQYCNGLPEGQQAACQTRCGDLYNTAATDEFTTCAITANKCVDQRIDENAFAPPPECALETKFDLNSFTGKWYITAGLNPLFDTFPCQDHYLNIPQPGRLDVQMNWRVEKGEGDFIHRSFVQHFTQVANKPFQLHNGGNKFLNYEDDWWVVASKPDAYQFVYYRGDNDAWKYYGGAVVYTRAASLPAEYIPEMEAAAARVGLKWSDFQLTDNTCGPPAPARNPFLQVEEKLEKAALTLEKQAERALSDLFGKPVQAAEGRTAK